MTTATFANLYTQHSPDKLFSDFSSYLRYQYISEQQMMAQIQNSMQATPGFIPVADQNNFTKLWSQYYNDSVQAVSSVSTADWISGTLGFGTAAAFDAAKGFKPAINDYIISKDLVSNRWVSGVSTYYNLRNAAVVAGSVGAVFAVGYTAYKITELVNNGQSEEATKLFVQAAVGIAIGAAVVALFPAIAAGAGGSLALWATSGFLAHQASKFIDSHWDNIKDAVQNNLSLNPISQAFADDLEDKLDSPSNELFDNQNPWMSEPEDLPQWVVDLVGKIDDAFDALITPPPGGAPRLGNESPLAIDLDGDGIELTNLNTDARYWDIDNDGFRDASAWVKGDDALLVMDRNANGMIDNHGELFGNQTDGFQILAQLDSNHDNKIDSSDAQFADLQVWQDLNQDGVSQANELKTLTQASIQSISLNAQAVNYQVAGNDVTSSSLVTMTDGSTRNIVDAWFKYDNTNTLYDGDYSLDPRTFLLPTLRGYGEIKDLHIAMSQDEALLDKVATLTDMDLSDVLNATADFDGKFRDVLYSWSGKNETDDWRNSVQLFDKRKTQLIDDLSGRNYSEGVVINGNTYTYAPTMLVETWHSVLNNLEARFLAQTVFKPLFAGTPEYNNATDLITGITGLSSTGLSSITTLINASSDRLYGWTMVAKVIEGSIGLANLTTGDRTMLNNAIAASVSGQTLALIEDAVKLGAADDVIAGFTGFNNILNGNASDNVIEGRELNDTLNGGAGDDRLFGQQGNDTYRGGMGDDVSWENNTYSSDDTYIYDAGHDVIIESNGFDKIVFASGITLSDITISRLSPVNQSALLIDIANKGTIYVDANWAFGQNSVSKIDRIEFADASFIDLTTIHNAQNGTSGNDTITGLDRTYFLRDNLVGNAGNDTLNGGLGDDILQGGDGSDNYIYNFTTALGKITSGYDVIIDSSSTDTNTLTINNIRDPDKLTFHTRGTGYADSDRSLVIKYDGQEIISLEQQFSGGLGTIQSIVVTGAYTINTSTYQFEQVVEDGGNNWLIGISSGGSINNKMFGNQSSDRLVAYDGDDYLDGKSGNDELLGGLGNDTYIWNKAITFKDTITEEGGTNDILMLGGITDTGNVTVVRSADNVSLDVLYNNVAIATIYQHFLGGKNIEKIGFLEVSGYFIDLANVNGVHGTSGNDTLNGNDSSILLNDVIYGYSDPNGADGNDVLAGGLGNDILDGGKGNDTYIYASGVDTIIETGNGGGTDTVLFGTGIIASNIQIQKNGNGLDIFLNGQLAMFVQNQFSGSTAIIDTIRFSDNSTIDLTTYHYAANGTASNETISGTGMSFGTINANGLAGSDTIYGTDRNDTVDGGADSDIVYAGNGSDVATYIHSENLVASDTYYGQQGNDRLDMYFKLEHMNDAIYSDLIAYQTFLTNPTNNDINNSYGPTYQFTSVGLTAGSFESFKVFIDGVEQNLSTWNAVIGTNSAETLNGDANDNWIFGKDGNDTLNGNNGHDKLHGGLGNDTMSGGLGNDIYFVDSASDVVSEAASAGTDQVYSSINYTLGSEVENLVLTGTAGLSGTGNSLNNTIVGNSGNNTISGEAGIDTMIGGLGDDTYVVDNVSDVITELLNQGMDLVQSSVNYTLPSNVENITLTGSAAINAIGNDGDNILTGNGGINQFQGGLGNDTYVIQNTSDTIIESTNAGVDTIQSSVTYTIPTNMENITLTGSTAINATGNSVANILTGNSGTNTLAGGAGDDTYVIQNTTDVITENSNEGVDTIQTSVTYTISNNVENIVLTDSAAINATGNGLNNALTGNSAANTLDGGVGIDTMSGGLGNDIYIIDNVSDTVIENTTAGTDTVQSSVTYTLSANVENITLTGSAAINATGNTLNNTITGNSGANILTGAGGDDTMIGGGGNDTYVVDSTGDIVTEDASAGTDQVNTSITYTLTANTENLLLLGSSNINGIGNSLNNILTGNAANNTLNGGAGADTMIGGLGDDIYVVDNTSDVTTESANEGIDTVEAAITTTLSSNIENLTLTGSSTLNGTGNALNNTLIGNAGINTLNGGDGNDYLNGGTGADTLIGGLGDDTYIIDNTSDVITENSASGIDQIFSAVTYTAAANAENLTLTGSSAINGTGNSLNNILNGNAANNVLSGGDGNDILNGEAGLDTLTGGNGTDQFIFHAASAFSNIDVISDFNIGQEDKINISDLLIGYQIGVSDLNDFVTLTTSGANTTLAVDRDGAGTAYADQSIATLSNTSGLVANQIFVGLTTNAAPEISGIISSINYAGSQVTANGALNSSTTDAIPNLTSDSSAAGTAAASGTLTTPACPAWRAFDGSTGTLPWAENFSGNSWVSFEFPTSKVINKYSISCRSDYADTTSSAKDWSLQAWDGGAWVTLHKVTNQTGWSLGETRTFTLLNDDSYAKYRIHVTANNGLSVLTIGEINLMAAAVSDTITIDPDITLSDVDGSIVTGATIRLLDTSDGIGHELLNVVTQTGVTSSYTQSGSAFILTLTGSASKTVYEQILESLTYKNTASSVTIGDRTLEISVSDSHGAHSAVKTVTIDVTSGGSNTDEPVIISNMASSTDYNAGAIVSDGALNASTTDAVANLTSDVSGYGTASASGTLTTPSCPAWRAFDGSTATLPWAENFSGNSWIAFQFPAAKIINKYTISCRSDYSDTTSIAKNWSFQGWDGTNWVTLHSVVNQTGWSLGETRTFTLKNDDTYAKYRIHITANNGLAVLTIGEINLIEAPVSNVVMVDPDITLSDADSSIITSATIKLLDHEDGISHEILAVTTQTGITASYSQVGSDFVLTLSGAASTAVYEQVLESLRYSNTATTVTSGARTIEISVIDNQGTQSAVHEVTLNVTGGSSSNSDEPVVISNMTASRDYDPGVIIADGTLNTSVIDAVANLTSDVSGFGTASASGTLTTPSCPAWRAFDGSTASLPWAENFSGNSWIAFQFPAAKVINKYTISCRSDYSDTTSIAKDWSFQGWDGTNWVTLHSVVNQTGWSLGETRTFTLNNDDAYAKYRIHITANNGLAVLTIGEINLIEAQDSSTVYIDQNISLSDADSSVVTGATITLLDHEDGISHEILAVTTQTGITANYAQVGSDFVLTLSGAASTAVYEQVLESLTYKNTATTITAGERTIEITITDNQGTQSSVKEIALHVGAGTTGDNTINGDGNVNTLNGGDGNDIINGLSGNDILYGGNDNDTLNGGNDNDILYGGDGLDTMTGGSGADTFRFDANAFNNIDVITDFNVGQSDKLNIADILTGYTSGVSDINDFVSLSSSGGNTSVLIDRDGAGGLYGDQSIVTLTSVTGLDVDDLLSNGNLIAA